MSSEKGIEKGKFFGPSFKPVLFTEDWQIAMLGCVETTAWNNYNRLERHLETDEVFVLTHGTADMIHCTDIHNLTIEVIPMEIGVAYNVKKGTWHNVAMSEDAHIVLFEKCNTSRENSEYYALTETDRKMIDAKLISFN